MSLGLKDLKKKRESDNKTAPKAAPVSTEAWSSRAQPSRPWDSAEIESGKAPARSRSRQSPIATDASMNEEWLSVHAEPLFWAEFSKDSILAQAKARIAKVENAAQAKVARSLRILRRFGLPV